jgi:hypothetical protein
VKRESFRMPDLIAYLEATAPDAWLTDRCRSQDGKQHCIYSHIFEFGGGDADGGSHFCDLFEECIATTYMLFSVNDGTNPDYQQATAKERCIAYFTAIHEGREPNVNQLEAEGWEEMKRLVLGLSPR